MFRRTLYALPVLAAAGCAGLPPPTLSPPRPAARRAGPVTLTQRVRQEGWMTRFWEQLTPSQRRRVLARMRRGDPPVAVSEDEAAPAWDALGLPERDALVFGAGLSRGPE
jgi:hypothetical protein